MSYLEERIKRSAKTRNNAPPPEPIPASIPHQSSPVSNFKGGSPTQQGLRHQENQDPSATIRCAVITSRLNEGLINTIFTILYIYIEIIVNII